MAKNNDSKNKKKKKDDHDDDWITTLAQNDVSNNGSKIPSKEDRKRRREAKKARRQKSNDSENLLGKRPRISTAAHSGISSSSFSYKLSKNRLRCLSKKLVSLREESGKKGSDSARPRPYYHPSNESVSCCVSKKRKRWNQNSIQPRPSDYNGIGMARNSLFIEFVDPSYNPKLEEEFREHIPGFFGKQRTKAMKKQRDGNMLWRRLANSKQKMSKKLKGMSPDERVQTLIESNIM